MDRPSSSSPLPSLPLPTVAVVGLGTMGTGIAEVLARAGREVIGIDISDAAARRGRRRPGAVHRPRRGARPDHRGRSAPTPLARFRTFPDLQAAADADLVIEVVPESYETKRAGLRARSTGSCGPTRSSRPAPTPCR